MSADRAVVSSAPAAAPAPAAPTPVDVTATALTGTSSRLEVVPTKAPATPAAQTAPAASPAASAPRPAWLPEKFKTPEDMASAYGELERRLGSAPTAAPVAMTDAQAAPPAAPPAAQAVVAKLTQEFAQSGSVSPESREAFRQATGLPDSFIDNQIAFMRQQESAVNAMATQRLGGEGAVRELMEWGAKRLNAADRQAFNRAAYSGDPAMAQLAIDGLAAKYEAEVGRAPRLIAGRKPQEQYGGVVPFQSPAEWQAARRDPRYKTDEGFRSEVELRLRAATELGLV